MIKDREAAREVAHLLLRLKRAKVRHDLRRARALSLGMNELYAVEHLRDDGDLTPKQLGDSLGLTSGAVTALVDRLARADVVMRRPHPQDGRSVVLTLTETGRAVAGRHHDPLVEDLAQSVDELTPDERECVGGFLDRALGILEHHVELAEPRVQPVLRRQ